MSWRIVSGGSRRLLRADPSSPSVLYSVDVGVQKSLNTGVTWAEASDGLIATSIATVAASSTGHLYAALLDDVNVFSSANGGTTWSRSPVVPSPGLVLSLLVDPATPSTIYAGTCEGMGGLVYRSLDDGATWSQLATGLDPNACVYGLAVSPGESGALFAAAGLLYRLSPSSGVWATRRAFQATRCGWIRRDPRVSGPAAATAGYLTATTAASPGRAPASTSRSRRSPEIRTDRASCTRPPSSSSSASTSRCIGRPMAATRGWWRARACPDDGAAAVVVDPRSPAIAYATTEFGIYRTVDGGLGWEAFDRW